MGKEIRDIDTIIIHCSASDRAAHDDWRVIKRWHLERGWRDIGYHYIIQRDGGIRIGRPIHEAGAHVKGHNDNSIGICLTGDQDFTVSQFETLGKLVKNLRLLFNLEAKDIKPHNAFNIDKTCPNFKLSDVI